MTIKPPPIPRKDASQDGELSLTVIRQAVCAASELLKNLANSHRLQILCMLADKEMSVSEIRQHIDLDQSPLSQHLARLRADGLVKTRRLGSHMLYSLDSQEAREVIQTLYRLFCDPERKRPEPTPASRHDH